MMMKQYGMTGRPFGFGCQPKGSTLIEETNGFKNRFFAIIECEELTKEQIYKYELVDIEQDRTDKETLTKATTHLMAMIPEFTLEIAEDTVRNCKTDMLDGSFWANEDLPSPKI